MTTKNQVHLAARRLHVRVWFHEIFFERVYGIYTERMGGWV